jgi:hypothetical protein
LGAVEEPRIERIRRIRPGNKPGFFVAEAAGLGN